MRVPAFPLAASLILLATPAFAQSSSGTTSAPAGGRWRPIPW
jgi:hypothetical protein